MPMRGIATTLLAILTVATPLLGQDRATTAAVERGRRLLQAHLEVLDVPAMQIAVARGDELLWSEAFGLADLEDGTPATTLTRFPIASVSKTLTAVAAAVLADESALDLDAPVRTYVPSFPRRGGRSRPGSSRITPPGSATTTTARSRPKLGGSITGTSPTRSRSSPAIRCCSGRARTSGTRATGSTC